MAKTIFTNLRNKKYRLNNEQPGSKCVLSLKVFSCCSRKSIRLLFMLAYQRKNDDKDENNGDRDEENQIGRH